MRALVTGGTGFMGRSLVKKLDSLGWEVHVCNTKTANLSDYKNLLVFDNAISNPFDVIFHLAANTKAGDWCVHNSGIQWITNQLINTNIIKFWAEKHPKAKMVAMGTSCSYDPDLPLREDYYEKGQPEENLYYYAQTKRMLLTGLRAVEKQMGLEWLYLVPSTLYGPGYDAEDNHFIFDLVRKIYSGKHKGTQVELWGDGTQKRELIHVNDFVELLMKVLDRKNEVINMGRGKEHSIKHYADTISSLLDYNTEDTIYNTDKFVGVKSKCLDVTKLETYVPNFEYTSLREGLSSLINWEDQQHGKKIFTNPV
jgi:GDP-L-fucose synthase